MGDGMDVFLTCFLLFLYNNQGVQSQNDKHWQLRIFFYCVLGRYDFIIFLKENWEVVYCEYFVAILRTWDAWAAFAIFLTFCVRACYTSAADTAFIIFCFIISSPHIKSEELVLCVRLSLLIACWCSSYCFLLLICVYLFLITWCFISWFFPTESKYGSANWMTMNEMIRLKTRWSCGNHVSLARLDARMCGVGILPSEVRIVWATSHRSGPRPWFNHWMEYRIGCILEGLVHFAQERVRRSLEMDWNIESEQTSIIFIWIQK